MKLRIAKVAGYSVFVLPCLAYLLFAHAPPASAQKADTDQQKSDTVEDETLAKMREVVRSTVLPQGFMRDMAGLQGTSIVDISGLRDGITAELRTMGLSVAAPSGRDEQPKRYALFHFGQVLSDTPDFRDIESVTFQVRVYPDHGRAEEAFIVDAMGSSLAVTPGSPDRSAVGEASVYVTLDPQLQITVYALRRNVVYEVGCRGIKREPKNPKDNRGPMERLRMPDLPVRCTDLAKVVDQWLRNAE